MTNICDVKSLDGHSIIFDGDTFIKGSSKDVYFNPDKKYVVSIFHNATKEDFYRIYLITKKCRNFISQENISDDIKKIFCLPQYFLNHEHKLGIVFPFYGSNYFFNQSSSWAGLEKIGYWFSSAKNFNLHVSPEEKGSLLGFNRACRLLSKSVKILHKLGIIHPTLSQMTTLVDPTEGESCMLGIEDCLLIREPKSVLFGSMDCAAPELISTEFSHKFPNAIPNANHPDDSSPSVATDNHSLAVLIYNYLFHRHPLRGSKVLDCPSEYHEYLSLGEKAVFIENPSGDNRLKITPQDNSRLPWWDTEKLPYSIMGPYLQHLFEKAFIQALHNPSDRPSALDWETALLHTKNRIINCENPSCPKKQFVLCGIDAYISPNNKDQAVCPYCGSKRKGQIPILIFNPSNQNGFDNTSRRYVIFDIIKYLYPWNININYALDDHFSKERSSQFGYFTYHQDRWMLVNTHHRQLRVLPEGKKISENSTVPLKDGLQFSFGDDADTVIAEARILNLK